MPNRRRTLALFLASLFVAVGVAQADNALHAAAPNARPAPPGPRTIVFSGHTWTVKSSSGQVGPGPNFFSDSASNVWVDAQGRLHLRITKSKGKWQCAEIVSVESFGYGTYRFYLDSAVDSLDPSVVLGLFTWNDVPDYNHRELDIEFSRWGAASNQNAQYVVQPYDVAANIVRFEQPAGVAQSTHSFRWMTGGVAFQSVRGFEATNPAAGDVINTWSYSVGSGTPVPGGENARLNLWLFQGRAPTDGREVEIVVNRFQFIPG